MPFVPLCALSLVAWNAGALFDSVHGERRITSNKFNQLYRLTKQHDIVVIQESHGDTTDVGTLMRKLLYRRIYPSYCPSSGGGG
eukprot:2664652-Pyramimonas_sp.AAC.1